MTDREIIDASCCCTPNRDEDKACGDCPFRIMPPSHCEEILHIEANRLLQRVGEWLDDNT